MTRIYGLDWLADQAAARIRRANWEGKPHLLAEELWTILTRLRDDKPQSVEREQQDGTVVTFTNNNFVTDFTFSDETFEETIEPDPDGGGGTVSIIIRWDRTIIPCLVGTKIDSETEGESEVGVQTYNCTLYPHGVYAAIYKANFDPRDDDETVPIIADIALQLQIDSDETIPVGTWTMATRIVKSKVVTTTTIDPNGIRQAIKQLEAGNFIQLPIWMGPKT